ncbi:hypothetical protein JMJ56_28360 [Belnapia sp. T18]|uniref:Uncharacterized protein n=1 Tax=Belnapia arida TaxID=2804533 RepID=A0ABS1UB32_9PROT|nr:hypothetical protein [Belnapia arida]MBL6081902.1 hypothetical protein [Belnapia arida]
MTGNAPVYLRWRDGRPAPVEECFDNLDTALEAVEARWEALQHQAPQILDARRILLLSKTELAAMWEDDALESGGSGDT